ncbi:MAG: hypothetical protein KGO49_02745 [Gammaproteobacteria bacterium]|nr:hypothetical protein [Gammaproteobacteria bacterium]
MNAQFKGIYTDQLVPVVRKVDLLHQYRENKQAFLNLGSVLIDESNGTLFIFDANGELVRTEKIQI